MHACVSVLSHTESRHMFWRVCHVVSLSLSLRESSVPLCSYIYYGQHMLRVVFSTVSDQTADLWQWPLMAYVYQSDLGM